ncbi:MAG: DUF819 family protein [Planctomycetota bacterium]
MQTLLSADDTWLLWAFIAGAIALAVWLERTWRWAARVGGPLLLLGMAMILANLRILPRQSPVYDVVSDSLVPLALPLLLLQANVIRIVRTTGGLLVAFHIASLGTVLGAFLAAYLIGNRVESPEQVSAIMTGSYIGGGVNFFAIASSYHTDGSLIAPLIVADNLIMAAVFLLLLTLCANSWMLRFYRHPHIAAAADEQKLAAEHFQGKEISLLDLASALAISLAVVAVARATAAWVPHLFPEGSLRTLAANLFIHLTFWSTLVATFGQNFIRNLQCADMLGSYFLYAFLFVIGLPADLWSVFVEAPWLFLFCLIMALTNVVVTFLVGVILRLTIEDLSLAVNASLGGPATAATMAVSKGWSKLVIPGVLVGVWGYIIGTPVGLAVGDAVEQWLK